jgi:hypothetical protein
VFGFGLPVAAQKKGKPKPSPEPADVVGIAWIGNDAFTPCAIFSGPGVHGDCQGTNGAYVPDGGEDYPKLLSTTGAFWLQTYGDRFIRSTSVTSFQIPSRAARPAMDLSTALSIRRSREGTAWIGRRQSTAMSSARTVRPCREDS